MLNGLYQNMPVFLEDNFLILEHKVSFGFVLYSSSVLIYKKCPQGIRPLTAWLSCQWSVAQQRDSSPGYVDRCWIRNFITTIGHFISNITIVKVHKLPGSIYWNMVCLLSTVCIFSMTLIAYTYLSNMACPNRVVSWANTVCVHWTGHYTYGIVLKAIHTKSKKHTHYNSNALQF